MIEPSPDARWAAIDVLARWVIADVWDNSENYSFAALVKGLSADILGAIEDRADCIADRPNRLEIDAARRILGAD